MHQLTKTFAHIIIIIKVRQFYLDQDGDCDDSMRTIQSLVVSAVELGVETVDLQLRTFI